MRIPPVKIWKKGEYNDDLMKLVMHQTRKPDWCAADLNALIHQANATRAKDADDQPGATEA